MGRRKTRHNIEEWKTRLERAKNFRETKIEQTWRMALSQYKGESEDDFLEAENIHVNLAFPTIKVLLRASCSENPYIYITGTRPWFEESARVLQFLENRLWRMQERKAIVRLIVLDALLLSVGYGMSHVMPNPGTGLPDVYLTRVSPYDLWIEPGAVNVEDAYYVFRRVVLSREEAKKRWPKANLPSAKIKSLESGLEMQSDSDQLENVHDDTLGRVEVYEVHDQLHHEISVISPDYDSFLDPPRQSPYPLKSLFTQLVFNEIVDEHYGIADLEPVMEQQRELDRLRTLMLVHTKRFNRKYKLQKHSADKEALDALESGEDGVIVQMNDIDGLQPITDAPLSSDVYNYQALIRNDHREITGINEYLQAGQVGGTKTAYEAEQIMAGARLRLGEKVDLVGDFAERVAFKDIEIMKKLYPSPQVAQFYGPDGEVQWRIVQKEELQGEHFVEVHSGSMRPRDESANFQRAILLYQTFANDPAVNHEALLNTVMGLMNVRDKNALLSQAPVSPRLLGVGQGVNPRSQELPNPNAVMQAVGRGGLFR
ncbi:MAG: hypothetical protein J7K15_02770 [Deltaproteobacteria bacterium]|nr:hypothetical protein [Deltaproteobacteria bacterium]